jgi:hypothetical protein
VGLIVVLCHKRPVYMKDWEGHPGKIVTYPFTVRRGRESPRQRLGAARRAWESAWRQAGPGRAGRGNLPRQSAPSGRTGRSASRLTVPVARPGRRWRNAGPQAATARISWGGEASRMHVPPGGRDSSGPRARRVRRRRPGGALVSRPVRVGWVRRAIWGDAAGQAAAHRRGGIRPETVLEAPPATQGRVPGRQSAATPPPFPRPQARPGDSAARPAGLTPGRSPQGHDRPWKRMRSSRAPPAPGRKIPAGRRLPRIPHRPWPETVFRLGKGPAGRRGEAQPPRGRAWPGTGAQGPGSGDGAGDSPSRLPA